MLVVFGFGTGLALDLHGGTTAVITEYLPGNPTVSGSNLGASAWAGPRPFRSVVLSEGDASFDPCHPCPLPLTAAQIAECHHAQTCL